MGIARFALLLAAAGVAAGCESIEVKTESAPRADLGALRTWGWAQGQQIGTLGAPEDRQHVLGAVADSLSTGLAKSGLASAAGEAPDVFVAFEVSAENVSRYVDYTRTTGHGYAWRGFHPMETTEIERVFVEYALGTLVVDLVDAKTGHFLWRGTAQAAVDRELPRAEKESLARDAAAKIVKEFSAAR
jgi:hypothetical protein